MKNKKNKVTFIISFTSQHNAQVLMVSTDNFKTVIKIKTALLSLLTSKVSLSIPRTFLLVDLLFASL